MEIYLIRHTTPAVKKGTCYGQLDIAVDDSLFEAELKNIQAKIPSNLEAFYTSPLKRCQILASHLTDTFKADSLLKELNFGDWEGKLWNDIPLEESQSWMKDFVNVRTPNGENYHELHQRTQDFIKKIIEEPYSKIGVVTHAGNIRSFISYTLGLPLDKSFRVTLNYGAVVHVDIQEDLALSKLLSIS